MHQFFVNKKTNELSKKFASTKGSVIILTSNEIKDITKVIKILEKREILLKRTTEKIKGH